MISRRKLMKKRVKYNYFAINGLESAVIEKFFVLEESLDLNGKTYQNARSISNSDLNFELIYPEHLVLKLKLQQLNRTCNRHQNLIKNQFFPLPKKHRCTSR
jgi:hypothetical protein